MDQSEEQLRNRIDNLYRQLAAVKAELFEKTGLKVSKDDTRYRIERVLKDGPMKAIEIIAAIGTSPQNVRYLLKKYFVKAGKCRWANKS